MKTRIVCVLLLCFALPVFAEDPVDSHTDASAFVRPIRSSSARDPERGAGFDWSSAAAQAGRFLVVEHAFRLATEPGTREGLKGPFFQNYFDAVSSLHGWSDGDPFLVNYIGHPMEGAVAGFIAVQNDRRFRSVPFGRSGLYWKGRLRAMAFSAAYSEQFEIGPFSEASIGAIQSKGRANGIVDHIVTPTMGAGWIVAEDALDRYVIASVERWTTNPIPRSLVRSLLNPSRSFANILAFKAPWHRDTRPGILEYKR